MWSTGRLIVFSWSKLLTRLLGSAKLDTEETTKERRSGMVKIITKYTCGCGFRTISLEEALLHSERKHHSLNIQEVIQKDSQPKPKKS